MAQWDPETGKVRPTWDISFSPWWVFAGSGIAGVVCAGIVFLTVVLGSGDQLNESGSVVQGGMLLLGIIVAVFLILGPSLAWGLGFLLRTNPNHNVHVIAFAALGLAVGFMLGNFLGLGALLAPAAGIGAGAGRWAVSSHART